MSEIFVLKGSSEMIVQDATPSEECKDYHRYSYIQFGFNGKSFIQPTCKERLPVGKESLIIEKKE